MREYRTKCSWLLCFPFLISNTTSLSHDCQIDQWNSSCHLIMEWQMIVMLTGCITTHAISSVTIGFRTLWFTVLVIIWLTCSLGDSLSSAVDRSLIEGTINVGKDINNNFIVILEITKVSLVIVEFKQFWLTREKIILYKM